MHVMHLYIEKSKNWKYRSKRNGILVVVFSIYCFIASTFGVLGYIMFPESGGMFFRNFGLGILIGMLLGWFPFTASALICLLATTVADGHSAHIDNMEKEFLDLVTLMLSDNNRGGAQDKDKKQLVVMDMESDGLENGMHVVEKFQVRFNIGNLAPKRVSKHSSISLSLFERKSVKLLSDQNYHKIEELDQSTQNLCKSRSCSLGLLFFGCLHYFVCLL